MTSRYLPRSVIVLCVCALLSESLACSTTRMMSQPLSDADRAELAVQQSKEWVIDYRRVLPKSVWLAARAEAIDTDAQAANDFPLDQKAKTHA